MRTPSPIASPRHLRAIRGLAATVALGVIIVGCGPAARTTIGTAPPSASGGASIVPIGSPVGTTLFISGRYRYHLDVAATWKVSATPGTGGVHPDEPGVDTFKDRAGHIISIVGEAAAALGTWTCTIDRHLEVGHDLKVERVDDIVVAGVPARLSEYHLVIEPYAIHYLTVEVVAGGQGVAISLESTAHDDSGDRAVLTAFLASLRLDT